MIHLISKRFLLVGIIFYSNMASMSFALDELMGFETTKIILYQSEDVLGERINDFVQLDEYVVRLQKICARFFATIKKTETLDVVVAVRPGKRSNVWLISSTRDNKDSDLVKLKNALLSVRPCDTHKGPIAFAIMGKVAGGDGKNPSKGNKSVEQPFPNEWLDIPNGHGENLLVPDGILDIIWPETNSVTPTTNK